jgi:hypothetical protein
LALSHVFNTKWKTGDRQEKIRVGVLPSSQGRDGR